MESQKPKGCGGGGAYFGVIGLVEEVSRVGFFFVIDDPPAGEKGKYFTLVKGRGRGEEGLTTCSLSLFCVS